MRSFLAVFGILCFFFGSAQPTEAQDRRELARFADQSTGRVIITSRQGTFVGSGYVIQDVSGSREEYLFLTNRHVIDGAQTIEVIFADDNRILTYNAELLEQSVEHDMALLRIKPQEDYDFQPGVLPLANYPIEAGDAVFAIGFPAFADVFIVRRADPAQFEPVITSGIVGKMFNSTWRGSNRPVQQIQHDAAINGGNSGGPLVNTCGTVVGLNTAKPSADVDGAFFSSSASTILDFLDGTIAEPTMAGRSCSRIATLMRSPMNIGLLAAAALLTASLVFVGMKRGNLSMPGAGSVSRSQGQGAPIASRSGKSSPSGAKSMPMLKARIEGESFGLDASALGKGVKIGRGLQNEMAVDHAKLSREHASLRVVDRKLFITDLGSTNGTIVDGKRLEPKRPHQINTKSRISLGGVDLTLARED